MGYYMIYQYFDVNIGAHRAVVLPGLAKYENTTKNVELFHTCIHTWHVTWHAYVACIRDLIWMCSLLRKNWFTVCQVLVYWFTNISRIILIFDIVGSN